MISDGGSPLTSSTSSKPEHVVVFYESSARNAFVSGMKSVADGSNGREDGDGEELQDKSRVDDDFQTEMSEHKFLFSLIEMKDDFSFEDHKGNIVDCFCVVFAVSHLDKNKIVTGKRFLEEGKYGAKLIVFCGIETNVIEGVEIAQSAEVMKQKLLNDKDTKKLIDSGQKVKSPEVTTGGRFICSCCFVQ